MSPLAADELARRAGVSHERVDSLVALGLIGPSAGDAGFADADVERIRLIEALEVSGTSAERLAEAVRNRRVPLRAITGVSPRVVEFSDRTISEVAARLGISLDLVAYVYAMWGLSAPEPGAPLRADDAALWDAFAAIYRGAIAPEPFVACNRVFAEGVRKVVDSVAEHLRADFEATFPDDAPGDRLAALGEEARRVFAFVDLAGFTALAEQLGDAEAAEKAAVFGRLAQETAQRFSGRLIKLLGDGAMLSFPESSRAVESALDLVAGAPSRDLPAARVGIAAGPVVRKDGDVFGRTVNLAARIADYARAGEVLVEEGVTLSGPGGGVEFDLVGPVGLKGVSVPVTVYAARA